MNVKVLRGTSVGETTDDSKAPGAASGKFDLMAFLKKNAKWVALGIGAVILIIFLVVWMRKKPKRKRTSGLAGTSKGRGGKRTTSGRKKGRRKSGGRKRKKQVSGTQGLVLDGNTIGTLAGLGLLGKPRTPGKTSGKQRKKKKQS